MLLPEIPAPACPPGKEVTPEQKLSRIRWERAMAKRIRDLIEVDAAPSGSEALAKGHDQAAASYETNLDDHMTFGDLVWIALGTYEFAGSADLARLAGFIVERDGTAKAERGYTLPRLATALSEGYTGDAALVRMIALKEASARAAHEAAHALKLAELHYATQTARLDAARLESETATVAKAGM